MSQATPDFDVLDDLLTQLWEQEPSPQQRQQINELLRNNPHAQRRYLEHQLLHADLLDPSGPLSQLGLSSIESPSTGEIEPAWLTQIEEKIQKESQAQQHSAINKDNITARQLGSLAGYVLGKALTSKLAYKSYACAAALLIGVFLFVVFGPDASEESFVSDDPAIEIQPDRTPAPRLPVVATLTAERDAAWDRRPGDDLYAGQRFTLTQGFAEVTTESGAVVVIEAPATIELLENTNAIQLHSGKLVGICETESSKGLLVRTPHMDITDLGTRFGVDTNRRATEVHIFEGEVQTLHANDPADTQPTLLVAGQAARSSADNAVVAPIDHAREPFAAMLPGTIQLPGTGVGLERRDIDPNWQVIAVNGNRLETPKPLAVNGGPYYTEHIPNDPATAQWIAFKPDEQAGREHTYLVRTTIDLPRASADNPRVRMVYMADNAMRAVVVNGKRIELPEKQWLAEYESLQEFTIAQHLKPGINTIEFELVNIRPGSGRLSLTGLRVAWELQTRAGALDTNGATPR